MNLYVIRRRQAWKTVSELEKAASTSARVGNEEMPDRIRWIRSYVVKEADGQLGTVCIYQAADEITPVANTVIVRDDPAPAAKAA